MSLENQSVLDTLFSQHALTCRAQKITVSPDDLVHVVGAQEPVRNQPDERTRLLSAVKWLELEYIQVDLPEAQRMTTVGAVQKSGQTWFKAEGKSAEKAERDQARWLSEKTRSYESAQQIAQRVWLALVLYSMGQRGLTFDVEGQIRWSGGLAGRVGLSPDEVLDIAWAQPNHTTFAASFRAPDGTILRGKGRQRWHTYRLVVHAEAGQLFERRAQRVEQRVALIVASETYATQPQLPRDFYGGDEFQQACIDAQDQRFEHILVLSPEHGVISLDDTIPSDQPWDEMLERRVWQWQVLATQRLGKYLFGEPVITFPKAVEVNWWNWMNPESSFEITIFGGGFAVGVLVDYLLRSRVRAPQNWPKFEFVAAPGRGYIAGGEYDLDLQGAYTRDDQWDDATDDPNDFDALLNDIDSLFELSGEFVNLVNVYVTPTNEYWDLAPDEALLPVRLLTEAGLDFEEFLDLLTDMTVLLERRVPLSLLINAGMAVSILLQVSHNIVHSERDTIAEVLTTLPEDVLKQYIERVTQEPTTEDQLCGLLSLGEQLQFIALTVPPGTHDQLAVWLQTYMATRMRQQLLGREGGANGSG